MADNRTPRDADTRANDTRTAFEYKPPSTLPDPLPKKGFVYRWVRTHILAQPDAPNVASKMREGWVPVKATDVPELHLVGNKEGNVEVGGLMLCIAPKEFVDARNAYYERQSRAQVESVNNHFMRQQDARMPLFAETQSTATRGKFGSGTK